MSRKPGARHAVFLLSVPTSWKPQRVWDFPPVATGARLVARNLLARDAAGHARAHNKGELEARQKPEGVPTGEWAIVVKCIRPRCRFAPAAGKAVRA